MSEEQKSLTGELLTWDTEKEKQLALYSLSQALSKNTRPMYRSRASDIYYDIGENNNSVTDSFNRRDYEHFRPEERIPKTTEGAIFAANKAYKNFGIIRNYVDLMADFLTKGITISHPDEKIQAEYREWFQSVKGVEASNKFGVSFFLVGNTVVYRRTSSRKRKLPIGYAFLNPLQLAVVQNELSFLFGESDVEYGIRISHELHRRLKYPKTDWENRMRAKISDEMRQAVDESDGVNGCYLPLDRKKIAVYHYKKSDWEKWADPMIRPVLGDLQTLEKMRLADLAALDGAISCIRLWKLGSLEHKILPSPAEIIKLGETLTNNIGGGVMNLVWGPAIELVETDTSVHNFLGETKYKPVLQSLYGGIGIPPTLTGGGGTGFTNNMISLKTLVERLNYAREMLKDFWTEELRLVAESMGYSSPAHITFGDPLADEVQEKNIWLALADRGLCSIELFQERFGMIPEIEEARTRREEAKRKQGVIPLKAGPFHDANHLLGLEKIFAQSGAYPASEFGLDIEPGDDSPNAVSADEQTALSGEPGQGRPVGKKDTTKRKDKVVRPRSVGSIELFAREFNYAERAQQVISKVLTPLYLKMLNKGTLRELSETESERFERFKFDLLCEFKGEYVDETEIKKKLDGETTEGDKLYPLLLQARSQSKDLTLDNLRRLQSVVYATSRCSELIPERES